MRRGASWQQSIASVAYSAKRLNAPVKPDKYRSLLMQWEYFVKNEGKVERHKKENRDKKSQVTCLVEGKSVDVVFLNLSEAFGTVSHSILLEKLADHGLDGDMLKNKFSAVLGPVLLNSYTNDLDKGNKCPLSKFADNTKLGGSIALLEGRRALQKDLDRLAGRAKPKCMRFNKVKCQVLHFGYRNPMQHYRLGQSGWKAAQWKKDLGLAAG
ncbi:rna-directed dna polymerase from mobile element jockey-like [Willisornis vidua]|uniref:Rna-directed dna polymerase from mobile element jockey-like n=1 Tax=Willisornis vidua TaxID=1566151 RepID=A0ABQ9DUJ3_9PASS|nr:rna-directed dna polymerase from mobile element jockey-like [Willisornis vidua]